MRLRLLLQFADVLAHAPAQLGVEVRQRLVEEQHLRLQHERAGDRDALLLAAGEFGRRALLEPFRPTSSSFSIAIALASFFDDALHGRAIGDVLEHRHVREQRIGLEHHAHVAVGGRELRHVAAADQDLALARHLEAGDHAQGRGLAAAGGAEQGHELARLDGEGDVVHGRDGAVALGHVAEFDGGRLLCRAERLAVRGRDIVSWTAARTAMGRSAPRRPRRRSPTASWIAHDGDQHDDDEHGGIGDGEAELARLDAADDIGRRHVVLGGDEEDHGAHRGHGAHEGIDERGDDGRPQQRQHHAAHGGGRARAQGQGGLVEALVDLAQGGDAGAHADRHVAEDEAHHEDEARAGDLDRRHVEGEDVGHADDRAGDGEAQQRAELEGALAGEALPGQQIGGEQADGGGERRRERGDLRRVAKKEFQAEPEK